MVLNPRLDVVGRVRVGEEAVCYRFPHSGVGVVLGHHVVKPVVKLLVWRGSPRYCHFALDRLLQLNWSWRLGLIWKGGKDL